MDNQQYRLHHDVPGAAVSRNVTLLNPLGRNENFLANYTAAQIALLLVPSVVFLLLFPVRVFRLCRASLKVTPNYVGVIKVLLTGTIAAIELAVLVLYLALAPHPDSIIIVVHAIHLVVALAICYLSFLEHGRSVKPSALLIIYLLASVVCEGILLPDALINRKTTATLPVEIAALGLKALFLVLESISKQSYLRPPYKELPIEQTVSDLNDAFLFWMNRLIILGNSKLLSNADLPSLNDGLKSRDLRVRMEDVWDETPKPAQKDNTEGARILLWALFKLFKGSLLINAVPRITLIVFRYSQPILINRAVKYLTEPVTETKEQDATGYHLILAALVIYIGSGLSSCTYNQGQNKMRVQTRGALIGLIHARCLTMRDGIRDDVAAVTLVSSDTDNAENLPWLCQESWAQMAELLVGIAMLRNQLGWWCLTPLVIVFLFAQASRWIAPNFASAISGWQKSKQKRLALTTSMIDYIKNIKMMGMTSTILARVQDTRMIDVKKGVDVQWIVVYFQLIGHGIEILAPVATLIFYTIDAHLRGKTSLDPTTAFTSIAIITLVTAPANTLISIFPHFANTYGCATRIQAYLLEPSRDDRRILIKPRVGDNNVTETSMVHKSLAVIIEDIVLRPAVTADICLDGISMQLTKGSLNVICGAIGTGKTTLIRAVLGDLNPDRGSISVSTKRIGYCAQKPWLINASVKSIICGLGACGTEVDEDWYKTVVYACGLEKDIKELSAKDETIIGSRGVTLSGGQRQRLALARAVYANPEIIILDDVLSALDSKTEAHVVRMLLAANGLFRRRGTTVILITHATQHLPLADQIIVLANSKIEEQGTWDELRSTKGYVRELQNKYSDSHAAHIEANEKFSAVPVPAPSLKDDESDLSRKTGDMSVYLYYFKRAGLTLFAILLFCNIAYGALLALATYILKTWSESDGLHMWYFTGAYALSSFLAFIAKGSVTWAILILIAPKAGKILHYRLLNIVIKAPLAYFDATDTGMTLNRFSQDMQYVDRALPYALMNSSYQLLKLIAQLVLLILSQALTAVIVPFLFVVLYFLQKFYLHTSRQIRLLDIEHRAEVLSSFLETLEGISHIRAFGWQFQSIDQNITNLDISQRPNYIMDTMGQWLALVLDLLVAALAVLTISLAIVLKDSTTGGQIGLALTVILTISSTLGRLLESWTQLETSLGAVARIKSLEENLLPEDEGEECLEPFAGWPDKGAIEFKDVVVQYNSATTALKNISIKISPGKKIGICGRTGSGKSTLLLSLLRLVNLQSGTILVDGINISTLSRDRLRESMIAIPQDVFILDDSIRTNLDPSGIIPDNTLIKTMEKVHLWKVLENRSAEGEGVSDPLSTSLKSTPLSQGESQLFSLARALLLKNRSRILMLDEATSNVDMETDKLIQEIIREEFKGYTILTVAHRLDSIRDADLILVLDRGRVVEVGEPGVLLAKKTGETGEDGDGDDGKAWFREMWEYTY